MNFAKKKSRVWQAWMCAVQLFSLELLHAVLSPQSYYEEFVCSLLGACAAQSIN